MPCAFSDPVKQMNVEWSTKETNGDSKQTDTFFETAKSGSLLAGGIFVIDLGYAPNHDSVLPSVALLGCDWLVFVTLTNQGLKRYQVRGKRSTLGLKPAIYSTVGWD